MAEHDAHPANQALFLWVAGELDDGAAAGLEEHLRHCSECARRLEQEAQLEVAVHEVAAAGQAAVGATRLRRVALLRWGLPALAAAAVLVTTLLVTRPWVRRGEQACGRQFAPTLGERPSREVFGYGDHLGVTRPSVQEARFDFEFPGTAAAVYFVAFEARSIEREKVELSLNGAHVGYVTPSQADAPRRQRHKLPRRYLRAGIPNELVFDHVDNPPHQAPWAIGKVRLIARPRAACTGEECLLEASKAHDLALEILAKKDAAPESVFLAWRSLHASLLFLDGLAGEQSSLYPLAQATLAEVDLELDQRCNEVLAAARHWEALGEFQRAVVEYRDGLAWFPESDDQHPCREELENVISVYVDLAERFPLSPMGR